jgi:hypothetical protein
MNTEEMMQELIKFEEAHPGYCVQISYSTYYLIPPNNNNYIYRGDLKGLIDFIWGIR